MWGRVVGLCEFSICMPIDHLVFRKVVDIDITCCSYQDYGSDLEQVFDFYLLLLKRFALLDFEEAIFM